MIGFTGALRRSEFMDLDVSDIVRSKLGIVLQIRTSKTDPNSAETEVAIPKGLMPARVSATPYSRATSSAVRPASTPLA